MDQFKAILLDPPWPFDTFAKKGLVPARGVQPYETMDLYEIAGLPVPRLAARDCAVFLWQSDSLPRAAALLADAWGFRLVTDNVFIWRKPSIGMGYWSRKEAETVALLTRGRPKRLSKSVRQVIDGPRREHSRKPDDIYSRIEALVGGPYLEMFARQKWPGWSSWGNQTDKFEAAPAAPAAVDGLAVSPSIAAE